MSGETHYKCGLPMELCICPSTPCLKCEGTGNIDFPLLLVEGSMQYECHVCDGEGKVLDE